METAVMAFILCQRAYDRKFLCCREKGTDDPFEFPCVGGYHLDGVCDALRAASECMLDLQLCKQELVTSQPINGYQSPPILLCTPSFLLNARIANRIQKRALLEVKFLSHVEIHEGGQEGLVTKETVDVLLHHIA